MPRYPGIFTVLISATYSPVGVVFDGADYLSRGAEFTDSADSALFTAAFSIMWRGTAADQHILSFGAAGAPGNTFILGRSTSNKLYLYASNTAGTIITDILTNSGMTADAWHNVLISKDGTTISFYVDDASAAFTGTNNAGTHDLRVANNFIGAYWSNPASFRLNGELADLWFDFGRYVDFSVEANRRKFFASDGTLIDKGADGSTPFSAVPIGFFSGSSWHINKGGGGGMTLTGALSPSPVPPGGAPVAAGDGLAAGTGAASAAGISRVAGVGTATGAGAGSGVGEQPANDPPAFRASGITAFRTTSATDPTDVTTSGHAWASGDLVLSLLALSGTTTLTSVAGLTDDTYASVLTVNPGAGHDHRSYLHKGTIGGGAFDATTRYDLSGTRRIAGGLMSISGANTTLHASLGNSGAGDGAGGGLPSCSSINTSVDNCLIIAIMAIRGAHVTNPPTAPSGYTMLTGFPIISNAANDPTSSVMTTVAIAQKVQASAGTVAAATYGGIGSTTQVWETMHIAVAPA